MISSYPGRRREEEEQDERGYGGRSETQGIFVWLKDGNMMYEAIHSMNLVHHTEVAQEVVYCVSKHEQPDRNALQCSPRSQIAHFLSQHPTQAKPISTPRQQEHAPPCCDAVAVEALTSNLPASLRPRTALISCGLLTMPSTISTNGRRTFSRVLALTSQKPQLWDAARAAPSSVETVRCVEARSSLDPTYFLP